MAASNSGSKNSEAGNGNNHGKKEKKNKKNKRKQNVKHEAGIVKKDNSRPVSQQQQLSKSQKKKNTNRKAAIQTVAGPSSNDVQQSGSSGIGKKQQPQQQVSNPPKSKKSKKRQRAAAAAAAAAALSAPAASASRDNAQTINPSSAPQSMNSSGSNTPVPSEGRRRKRQSQHKNTDAYKDVANGRSKGKGQGQGNLSLSLEEGEVDELAGLFFVDTNPQAIKHIPDHISRPTLPLRKSRSRSATPVKQTFDEKLLPDYVGSTSEIQEVDVVGDQGIQPVEGSSKDMLVRQPSPTASIKGKERAIEDYDAAQPVPLTAENPVDASTVYTIGEEVTLPLVNGGSSASTHIKVLEDLSSDDGSTSSEEDRKGSLKEETENTGHHSSASESEEDNPENLDGNDDLALNMVVDTVGDTIPQSTPNLNEVGSGKEAAPSAESVEVVPTTGQSSLTVIDLDKSTEDLDALAEAEMADESHDADASRYFKEDDPLRVCARCGETGHVVRDCVHVQCLTCGKLDDHGTRSCPLTMTCFRCNSRGHHIKDCPVSAEQARSSSNQFCERCSSNTHKSSTCPYIWRIYIRAADAPVKPPKMHMACYNCASAEHFGDDCKIPRGPFASVERTAFTLQSDNPRKSHIRFDSNSLNPNPMPRPNIVNGRTQPTIHIQNRTGTDRSGSGAARNSGREDVARQRSRRPALGDEIRRDGDFGDMSNLEAGEIDKEEESFARRLDANKAGVGDPKRSIRPGARDRRNQRSGHGAGAANAISIDDDSADSRRSYQPFKHIREPPGISSVNRPRSLSGSPPPRKRRRDERQPSPEPLERQVRDEAPRAYQSKPQSHPPNLQRVPKPDSYAREERRRPTDSGHRAFAAGSLLDRIDRGTATSTSASRDPRRYDSRDRYDYDDHRDNDYRDRDADRRRGDRYRGEGRSAPSQPHPRYRGGYF